MKRTLIAITTTLFLATAHAAEVGKQFEIAKADAFVAGTTTLVQAKEELGEPFSISTDAEGNQTIWWKYARVNLFGKDVRKLAVVFDKDGNMLRIAHREAFK